MTRKELKSLIRECYQEKLLENANPFTDVTISEMGNPFTDATIDEIKLSSKFKEAADIDAMDEKAKKVYEKMIDALEGVGKELRVDEIRKDIMEIPLIRDVVNKGYFSFTLKASGGGAPDSGDRNDAKIDYNKYAEEWHSVRDNRMSLSTKLKGDQLLGMLKKHDRQTTTAQENFHLVLVSKDKATDYVELYCSVSRPGALKKLFTLGLASKKVRTAWINGAGGKFDQIDRHQDTNDILQNIGRIIIEIVKEQGGKVSVKGADDEAGYSPEDDQERIANKAKIGMTVKENRHTRQ